MASLFRNYLIVDWSAANAPKTGAESIWYAWLERHRDGRWTFESQNPPTRARAFEEITERLLSEVRQSRATLAAFDFPFGYPRGAAARFTKEAEAPWRGVWKAIAKGMREEPGNVNNRFAVAAALNRKLKGPFWGRPASQPLPDLATRKPVADVHGLPEMRFADAWLPGPQSPWKLYGAGSAGGQALTGIPYVWRLRGHKALSEHTRVWPFETGLAAPFGTHPDQPRIVLAEAWPSLLRQRPRVGEVKDQTQVRIMAEHFARLDQAGRLARLFAGPRELTGAQRQFVEREEGWILGVV